MFSPTADWLPNDGTERAYVAEDATNQAYDNLGYALEKV
jgi:hypothetical protein